MALINPATIDRIYNPWETIVSRETSLTQQFSKLTAMSYRYPPPAPEGHGDMPQPAYHHGYGIPIPPLPSMARHHVPIVPTKADESNPSLRRSYSMPDTGPGQYPEQGQAHATLGEKKRNKLGYHRTSIACSKLPT